MPRHLLVNFVYCQTCGARVDLNAEDEEEGRSVATCPACQEAFWFDEGDVGQELLPYDD